MLNLLLYLLSSFFLLCLSSLMLKSSTILINGFNLLLFVYRLFFYVFNIIILSMYMYVIFCLFICMCMFIGWLILYININWNFGYNIYVMEYLKTFESYVNGSVYLNDILSLDEYNFSYKDSSVKCENNLFDQIVGSVVKKFCSDIFKFKNVSIIWTDKRDKSNVFSYYVRGSFLTGPILVLFESSFNSILDNYRLDSVKYKKASYDLLEQRIYDSLTHGICDVDNYYIFGLKRFLNYDNEENYVSGLVSEFKLGNVSDSVRSLCDKYCSKSWIGKDQGYNRSTNFY